MPTILELFKGSSKDISPKVLDKAPLSVDDTKEIDKKGLYFDANVYTSGTNYSLIKTKNPPKNKTFAAVGNFVEQELTGIRVKSLVDVNNPLIYGSDSIRIATRTTSSKDKMLESKGPTPGTEDSKSTSLNLTKKISAVRDTINSKLGIPTKQIPSTVVERINKQGDKYDTSKPVQSEGDGTELGKLLQGAGGNPKTIATQALGRGVGLAKDKLREKLFGKPAENRDANGDEDGFIQKYTSQNKKSNSEQKTLEKYRGITNKTDVINLLTPKDKAGLGKNDEVLYAGAKYKDFIPLTIGLYGADYVTIFRASIQSVNETVSPSWNTHKFLGNPFNFYSYSGVERNVSFSLKIYAGSLAELSTNWEKITELTRMAYPRINGGNLVNPPIIVFRLGDVYRDKKGFIENLTYELPDNGVWETDEVGLLLPKFINVNLTIKFIESASDLTSEFGIYGYTKSDSAKKALDDKFTQNKVNQDPVTTRTMGVATTVPAKPMVSNDLSDLKNKVKDIDKIQTPIQAETGNPIAGEAQSSLTNKVDGDTILEAANKPVKPNRYSPENNRQIDFGAYLNK